MRAPRNDDISNHRINRDLSSRLRAENPMKRVSTRVAPREVDGDKRRRMQKGANEEKRVYASLLSFSESDRYVITDFPMILAVKRSGEYMEVGRHTRADE